MERSIEQRADSIFKIPNLQINFLILQNASTIPESFLYKKPEENSFNPVFPDCRIMTMLTGAVLSTKTCNRASHLSAKPLKNIIEAVE